MGLEEFLGHSTGSVRGNFIGKWKKRTPPVINVWLNRNNPFEVVWGHNFARIFVGDDSVRQVWGANFVCHEEEFVVKRQFKRSKETGEREFPPERCGFCKMLEWLHQQIASGALSWVEPVFRFEGDDPKQTRVLHSGGLLNLYGKKNLTDDEKKELRQNGIFLRGDNGAWREVAWAKAQYVFCLVDHDNPGEGCCIDVEPVGLGDKLRMVLQDQLVVKGQEAGNPLANPYAFQFQHCPDEEEFDKKYRVRGPMEQLKLTDEIADMISADPPDTTSVTTPFNPAEVRAMLEEHALIEMPWDEFFPLGQAPANQAPRERPQPAPQQPRQAPRPLAPAASPAPAQRASKRSVVPVGTRPQPPVPKTEREKVRCSECQGVMFADAPICPHCGAEYDVAEVAPPPAETPLRTRCAPKSAAAKPDPVEDSMPSAGDSGVGGDDIPF
jgi:hypothetical protein